MTITAEELARDKALCEKATPGPWGTHAGPDPDITCDDGEVLIVNQVVTIEDLPERDWEYDPNAWFIAAAREGWPKYIAEVERLQTVERMQGEVIGTLGKKSIMQTVEIQAKDAEIARLKASLAQDQVKFQRETLRTDELTQMLHKFMTVYLHEGHTRGPWSRGCQRCELMTETEALLAKPLNVDAAVSGLSGQTPDKE